MSKWIVNTCRGIKVWYSADVIDRIKEIVQGEICEKCPEPCLNAGVDLCSDKRILKLIESEDE